MKIELGDNETLIVIVILIMIWGYFFGCEACDIPPPHERTNPPEQTAPPTKITVLAGEKLRFEDSSKLREICQEYRPRILYGRPCGLLHYSSESSYIHPEGAPNGNSNSRGGI